MNTLDKFADRHLGPSPEEVSAMLEAIGQPSLDALTDRVVPDDIQSTTLDGIPELSEVDALARLRGIFGKNEVRRSFIGRGYHDTIVPPVIQRNVLENPGWYTAYTPYQAEISQGRLEALLNFQTLITELTGLPVANASLLDEGTAAAEAVAMAAAGKPKGRILFVDAGLHAQTIDLLATRAEPIGIDLKIGDPDEFDFAAVSGELIGSVLAHISSTGGIRDYRELAEKCQSAGGSVIVVADPMALVLLQPPGEWGADIVVGSAQRFGVPMGFGGPHAAFLACTDKLKRKLPGRLIGVSVDAAGRKALRLSLQTREQHIRREKATSNICTAQVLLAVMAWLYAAYHGPKRLRRIALSIHAATAAVRAALQNKGFQLFHDTCFDTLTVEVEPAQRQQILERCDRLGINLRTDIPAALGITLDEAAIATGQWKLLFEAFDLDLIDPTVDEASPSLGLRREGDFLNQSVFNRFHTETEMMRYLRHLEGKDIALNWSMIPLGSCTMKLNAAAEMMPLGWAETNALHPLCPPQQATGYLEMIDQLETWLATLTGLEAVSLQPNAGSQGEYAGLLAIRRFLKEQGAPDRVRCLIPMSAHGTNPASAVMAGFEVVPVRCDDQGNIDLTDLKARIDDDPERLGAMMITYPSTHGVFEEQAAEACRLVHAAGGQVYLDGANLNAQVGLCSPGSIGADVCHLNLHKTFCIPHGGGGPGVGPIAVATHLAPYLPGHCSWEDNSAGAVSAAPYGSASILTISWMYIAMMGPSLRTASQVSILNANYIASRLAPHYPILYTGRDGLVAHECILDLRPIKDQTGLDVEDVAKRLIDYGFHAPTMSWPVPGTLMIEPTESESRAEIDRFCEAMIDIRKTIDAITSGDLDPESNPLKHSPHSAETLLSEAWDRPYSREQAAYPLAWVRSRKYWPPVDRVDNVHGDRNLVCTCEGMEAFE
ncbi:MAG: aminomethyl-transferring glycine dehydrogenase [Verrucomicrobiota bacterium]